MAFRYDLCVAWIGALTSVRSTTFIPLLELSVKFLQAWWVLSYLAVMKKLPSFNSRKKFNRITYNGSIFVILENIRTMKELAEDLH